MKKLLIGFVSGIVFLALGYGVYLGYMGHVAAVASASYLFAETDVKGKDGKALNRAALIDLILQDAVKRSAEAAPAAK